MAAQLSVPRRRSVAARSALAPSSAKAYASWQWFNHAESKLPAGRRALRINVDETAICLFQGGGRGNVFLNKNERFTQHSPLAQRRTYLTHVAFICDDVGVQPHLPQYIIAGTRALSVADLAAAQAAVPANVVIVRQARSWNTGALMVRIVRDLRRRLADRLHELQPVLLMDTAKIHLTRAVFAECSALGIYVVTVPPKLTWLLQPLDTDGFAQFKAAVRAANQNARIQAAATGDAVGARCLIMCVCAAIRDVLNRRPWASVFDRDGYGASQSRLGRRVRMQLELPVAPAVGFARPDDAGLQHCFPARTAVHSALIWRTLDAAANPPVAPEPALPAPPALRRSLRLRGLAPPALIPASGAAALPAPLLRRRAALSDAIL